MIKDQILNLINTKGKSADKMTSALKLIGDGNMENGINRIAKYFEDMGVVKGSVGTLTIVSVCYALVKLVKKKISEHSQLKIEGESILKGLEEGLTTLPDECNTTESIMTKVNAALKDIWVNNIKQDYDNGYLLKEDTLKNALYFHLRTKLSALLEENNLRIFTEYNSGIFKGTEYRPDLVIAKVDFDCDSNNYEDWIQECLCIIEIKYKQGFHSSESISKDFDKIKLYIENFKSDCQYYMATIWEYEDEATSWIDNDEWAKDKLTELNASFENDEMRFYVIKH